MATEMGEAPLLLDTPGVAELLRISERHVRRLVFERRIPYLKVGSRVRFDRAEVVAWIDTLRVVDHGQVDAKASRLALAGFAPLRASSRGSARDRARSSGRPTNSPAEGRSGGSTAVSTRTAGRPAAG